MPARVRKTSRLSAAPRECDGGIVILPKTSTSEVSTAESSAHGRAPVFLSIPVSNDFLAGYGRSLGIEPVRQALGALADGIASSSEWPSEARPVVVGKAGPSPGLAVFGHFTNHEIEGVRQQARHLGIACQNLLAFDFPRIAADCAELAQRLRSCLGPEVSKARFVAIPKGGLTVLGLVSVALGVDRSRLGPPLESDELLVVVDDCAISGARFAEALEGYSAPRVVFAHLCSHPELRRALVDSEPRVEACLAIRDLEEVHPPNSHEWRRRWQGKTTWKTYWAGFPQPIAFPWGEPDRLLWNPARQTIEKAWNLLPPSHCLKNRPQIPVQIQEAAAGRLRPADEVLYVREDEQIHLADLASGRSLALDPVASSMWLAVLREGTLPQAAEALGRRFEADLETIRHDLEHLVEELQQLGFLVGEGIPEIVTSDTSSVFEASAD